MPDDLDDLLRSAMKVLDQEVPSGYFEALPEQTLSRLEGSMQHGSGTTENRNAGARPPAAQPGAPQPENDEDSGLHDIRNLAASAKMRISTKRVSTSPPVDEDIAASSGSFRNIALPQPANMVSLPDVSELPSKKQAKRAAKSSVDLPAQSAATSSGFSLPSQQRRSKTPVIVGGVVVLAAAAAGGVFYMQQMRGSDEAAAPAVATASAPAVKADLAAVPPAAPAAVTATPAPTTPAPADQAAPVPPPVEQVAVTPEPVDTASKPATKTAGKAKATKGGQSAKKSVEKTTPADPKPVDATKPEPKVEPKKETKASGKGDGEDFDALLKEAGVNEAKKDTKPKLEKKSLSGDDFKKGMSSVENKAKACYKGTVGTAVVKLTVAPSGQVSKISVGGEFSGKPEASCLQNAVKGASFPPWDGGPQSFTYTYMLSD